MAKVDLADVGSVANAISFAAAVNDRLTKIESAVENTVSRDGTAPNQMGADFDMNSHRIMNTLDPVNANDVITLGWLANEFAATADLLLRSQLGDVAGSDLVGFTQGDTDAVAGTTQDKLRRLYFDAEDYGAVGDGSTDDANAINKALSRAKLAGVNVVQLQDRDYAISSSVVVPSGVTLVGKGAGQYPASAFATSANFLATPKTRLLAKAGFPALTPMVDIKVTRGDQYAVQGAGLEGLLIDCDLVADIGLRWRGVKNSVIRDVGVYRTTTAATSIGVLFDTAQGAAAGQTAVAGGASTITLGGALASPRDGWFVGATITTTGGTGSGQTRTVSGYVGATKVATVSAPWTTAPDATTVFSITGECLEGNGATQFNIIDGLWVWLGTTGSACGIEFNGDGVHDCNQNSYRSLRVIHANGPGVRCVNGDTEWVDGISTYAFGNGWGMEMYGSDTTNFEGWCRQNFYRNCLFGGASVGSASGTAVGGAGLTITLAASASAVNDYYNNKFITIASGTGAGQRRKITDYTGASKVALVEAWTTAPDATSVYSINGGGGVALFKGTYRTSRWHEFSAYETQGNGTQPIYAEDGGAFTQHSERDTTLVDTDGYELNLSAGDAYATGTSSRINFRRRVLLQPVEMASLREITTGAEGSETGKISVFTRKAGVAATETLGVGLGITINGGAECKKMLMATAALDFPSVAAGASQALTVTVTGAAANDVVSLGLPTNGFNIGLMIKGYVSAADTVTVLAQNYTAAPIDPGNLSIRVLVQGF